MKADRQEIIKSLFRSKGEVKLKELEERFPECSSMTLRRDIKDLEEQGMVKRTRGGAVAMSNLVTVREDEYHKRAIINTSKKMSIAQKALQFYEPGCSLFVDNGTTLMFFAREMPDQYCTVLTSGINIASELLMKKNPVVSIIGGQLNKVSLSATGVNATQYIESINIDIAFLGSSGFTLENGLSCGTYGEREVKRAVTKRARRRVALVDSSKFGRSMPFTFAEWEEIEALVSDDGLPEEVIREVEKRGVKVIL